jgi:hypothetical protein
MPNLPYCGPSPVQAVVEATANPPPNQTNVTIDPTKTKSGVTNMSNVSITAPPTAPAETESKGTVAAKLDNAPTFSSSTFGVTGFQTTRRL